jgi:hypothetical protein
LQNSHHSPKNNFTSKSQKKRRNGKSITKIKSFRKISDNDIKLKKKNSIVVASYMSSANKSNGFNSKELSNKSFAFLNKIKKQKCGQRYHQI